MTGRENEKQFDLFAETSDQVRAKKSVAKHQTNTCARCSEAHLSDAQLAKRFAVSRATIWRWVENRDGFPAPLRFPKRTTHWRMSDITEFEAQLKRRSKFKGQGDG